MTERVGSGGPPSVPQQVSQTDSAEKVSQSETKPAQSAPPDNTTSTPEPPKPQNPTAKMAEFALTGMARAAQFANFTKEETPKLPTDEVLKRNDNQKEPKPETQELQKQVNQWRAENGKKPIKEDGFFGPKTEAAVQEFQKANGLKKDGQAGVQTQNHILLENDPGFKKLDGGVKDQVRKQMSDYDKDSAKIQNLRDFATAPGLSKLSTAHQQQMLDMQKAHPDDPKFTSQLKTLANDSTFQNLNDATKTRVLNDVSKYAGDPGKIDNLTKLSTSPGFDKLKNTEQNKMLDTLAKKPDDAQLAEGLGRAASHPGYTGSSDSIKNSIVDTFAGASPLTKEKVDSTLGLYDSAQFKKLTDSEKAIVADGVKASKADPKYADSMGKLLADPKFQGLGAAEKTAVLSQVKNYPDARSVNNVDRLLQKDWFKDQSIDDKQRSLKTVAYLSQYDAGDRKVIDNTLEKMVGEKSDFKLVWKDYPNNGKAIYYGEGDNKTLWLNKGMLPADNNKMVENATTKELVVATSAHEINHLMNNDKVANTFHYYEAEYRAWYVGFEAKNGRPPTNQEAIEQRMRWQLNKDGPYGGPAEEAMKDPKEAQKFYDVWSKMSGQKVDASNWKTVVYSDASKWTTASDPAPVPSGNVDNH